jgi:hypothetical protein
LSKYIAIDLDPQGIFAVGGSARSGHATFDSAVAWDGTDGETPPALTAETAKQIGEQIRERLKAAGAAPAPVVVSIPRDRVILKELRYPVVPLPEEPSVVKFQAMKELTDAPDDVVVDYVPLSNGNVEGERRSMAVAIRKDLLGAIQALCTAANLKLAAITPRPYGIAAGVMRAIATGAAPRPEEKANPIAVLTLSPGGGEFTVVRPGVSGSNDVTFTRTIDPTSLSNETALLVAVRRNLSMYAGSNALHPIQALYVAEPEGRRVNQLKNALSIPVHAYDPLSGLPSTAIESNRGRFAGAAGLLAAKAFDELPINFVSPRQPKVKGDPKQKQILLGAGGLVLLVLVALGIGVVSVYSKEQKLAQLRLEKKSLEDEQALLEPDNKRLEAARIWKSRQVVWLDMLYDTTDQFHHTDGMVAKRYEGNALAPDPKTGKQDAQAKLKIQLTSRSPAPVYALISAMEADNPDPKTKTKYYDGFDKETRGSPSNDASAHEYIVSGKVSNRPPAAFTRFAFFSTPSRKTYPPPVAAPARKEPAPSEKDGKEAPAPMLKDILSGPIILGDQ